MTAIIQSGPFKGLRRNHYKTIVADPPWRYIVRSPKGMGRSPDRHYKTMTLDEIKALPVAEIAAKDCVLLLWVIDTHARMAFEVLDAWGFQYKTVGFYWAKTTRLGTDHVGMGHWTRANPEHAYEAHLRPDNEQEVERCFLNSKGSPKRVARDVRRLIVSPVREHSRKPDELHDRARRLSAGPYCELFAREARLGWTCWGDQVDKFTDPEIAELLGPRTGIFRADRETEELLGLNDPYDDVL